MACSGPGACRSATGPTTSRRRAVIDPLRLTPTLAAELRVAFAAAGYTADGVLHLLGTAASAALARGERVPALRATRDGSPVSTLVRLFLLQCPVDAQAAAAALPLAQARAGGVVENSGGEVRALLDVRPYASDDAPEEDWWVAADLGRDFSGVERPVRRDHVLGIGGASTTLAQLAVRPPVERALDLGTGSGVQALHLSRHARSVVATDVLPRALGMARFTSQLCGLPADILDLREGSLFEPVDGERFDLIVSNPPFVVHPHPAGAHTFTYRDSGFAGDEVCARIVGRAPAHLVDGGWAQLLGNWVHRRGEDWQDRVAGWLRPPAPGKGGFATAAAADVDAWIVQRDVQDPADYVSTWLRDSGEVGAGDYERRYDAWLAAFEEAGIEAVGFGYITLHRAGAVQPSVRIEHWPHPVEQPLGPHVLACAERLARLRLAGSSGLPTLRLQVAGDVCQEQVGLPGAEDPETVVLRQHRGLRRAHQVSTELAALVGACDGTVAVGALVAAVSRVLDEDEQQLSRRLLPQLSELLLDGLVDYVG